MDENKTIEGMLAEVLNEESSLKKISISVASAVLAASIVGSIVLYKEFIHIQDWSKHHEITAAMHINRISSLEDKSNKGGRWTLENHNEYARQRDARFESIKTRITTLERSTDLMEYKLEAMDDKLDKIVGLLNEAVVNRKKAQDSNTMSGM